MLCYEQQYALAIHSSFWGKKHKRWGLLGGRVEWREDPAATVARELQEEIDLSDLTLQPLQPFKYKGSQHMVFSAHAPVKVTRYDRSELLDLKWFHYHEVQAMAQNNLLHAGYELEAIRCFEALADETPAPVTKRS